MRGIASIQEEMRDKYPREGSIEEWWDKASFDQKMLIGDMSLQAGWITANTPWGNDVPYASIPRTKQRRAIDLCCATLSYDWTVIISGLVNFK